MDFTLLILGIIVTISTVCFCISENNPRYFLCFAGAMFSGLAISMSFFTSFVGSPTAMDVYRGKTTLEITYKDSVAIDSIVVFK